MYIVLHQGLIKRRALRRLSPPPPENNLVCYTIVKIQLLSFVHRHVHVYALSQKPPEAVSEVYMYIRAPQPPLAWTLYCMLHV